MITIDKSRCTACGLCATHCTEEVITHRADEHPVIGNLDHCLDCHHCVAVCPEQALSHGGSEERLAVHHPGIDGDNMENFLAAKRSCRHFRSRPLERDRIGRLIDVARRAPSSKNCEEREFIVVTDQAKLAEIRAALVRNNRKILRLLRVVTSRPLAWLINRETLAALRRIIISFVHGLAHEDQGHDSIFYGAPAVILIAGISADPFGKDNALAAQHYLMLQAQAMGLGSSIMGYAQVAPKILARHLDVPKHYKVYGVVAVGRAQAPVPADRRAQARQRHLGDRRQPARLISPPVASASYYGLC